jgi:hypothetical protein
MAAVTTLSQRRRSGCARPLGVEPFNTEATPLSE